MNGKIKYKIQEQPKVYKYETFQTRIKSCSEIDAFLNGLNKKYEVISVVQPEDTHGDNYGRSWQILIVTRYLA